MRFFGNENTLKMKKERFVPTVLAGALGAGVGVAVAFAMSAWGST
jgi:hypothetical protein